MKKEYGNREQIWRQNETFVQLIAMHSSVISQGEYSFSSLKQCNSKILYKYKSVWIEVLSDPFIYCERGNM